MANHVFTEDVLSILHEAGWREDREVDTARYVKALRDEGFNVFPSVESFLKNFADIKIHYVNGRLLDDDLTFDFSNEFYFSKESIAHDSQQVGIEFCPIGLNYDRYHDVLMDIKGAVYVRYADRVCFCGNSVTEALQLLLSGGSAKKIWP